jgi:hypothetical protein
MRNSGNGPAASPAQANADGRPRDHEDGMRKRGSDKKRTKISRDKRRRKKLGKSEEVPSR